VHPTVVLCLGISLSLLVGVVLTGWVRRYALAKRILDIPNERSSHTIVTPRGGGVAIVLCYSASLPALWLAGLLEGRVAAALLGAIAMALVGWRDDRASLPAAVRLCVQVASAIWAVAWLGGFPDLSLGSFALHLGVWGSVLAVLALVWLSNLYNFMDGIDGIAGSQAVVAGTAMAIILWSVGSPGLAIAGAVIGASACGFLAWNWAPARIFMGDVGSGTLGFAFGSIALAAERSAGVPALVLLLPLGVFIADATFTLFRRLLRGERVYAAHRSHVYQQLVQRGWRHDAVTSLVVFLGLGLVAMALVAILSPALTVTMIALAALALPGAGWFLVRRPASAPAAVPIPAAVPAPAVHRSRASDRRRLRQKENLRAGVGS
jgi:Fuc2NAc and GlcNAc transferase